MPFPKPAELPEWATFPTVPNVDPALADKQHGFVPTQRPPAQWFNWLFNLVYQWCAYLFDFENNQHTWADKQTFAANTMLFSGNQSWISNSPWLTVDMSTGMGLPNAINGIYLIGHNNTDPVLSLGGGVLLVSNNAIGASARMWNTGNSGVVIYSQNTGDSSWGLKIAQAAADGLGIGLQLDVFAVNGTGILVQGSSGGAYMNGFYNSGTAPTIHVENTGGGKAMEIGAGHVSLTGGNVAPGTAQHNMLSPALVAKAWCVVETDGANGVTLKSGQNIGAVALVASSLGPAHDLLAVTFASDFATDDVCFAGFAGEVAAVTSGRYVIQPWQSAAVGGDGNRHHQMGIAVEDLNAAGTIKNLGTGVYRIGVVFFGYQ